MKYSISKAARIVGVTRKTFYKHIDKKRITVEKDENDNPVIDASELIRVYGDQCDFNEEGTKKEETHAEIKEPVISEPVEVAVIKKELELLKEQQKSEKENFEEQIDYLRNKLDEANSEQRKLTALLTDQSSNKESREGEWKKSMKALEQRIANQEKKAKEREDKEKRLLKANKNLKRALDAERDKTLFEKLFG
jgi:DNA repair exonuclease SbcCD ATPase subunit